MVLGCNFFKWCIEDVADEKDAIINIQQNNICPFRKLFEGLHKKD